MTSCGLFPVLTCLSYQSGLDYFAKVACQNVFQNISGKMGCFGLQAQLAIPGDCVE